MSITELYRWKAFENEHLFPADLIDRHGAMLCSIVLNFMRAQGQAAVEMSELLLLHRAPVVPEEEDTRTEAEKMAAVLGR
jgi:hypothetical protein